MNLKVQAKEKALTEEEKRFVVRLAAILWLLPPKLRFRFFSAFHPDLRRFFEKQESGEGETREISAEVWGGAWVRWEMKRAKKGQGARGKGQVVTWKFFVPMELSGQILRVVIEVRRERSGRFRVQVGNGEGLVEALVAAVKEMTESERDFLWTLMDEALADYEDHLLATNPELIREHEEALAEIERGEYVLYGGEGSG